jgi:hypothetical protein
LLLQVAEHEINTACPSAPLIWGDSLPHQINLVVAPAGIWDPPEPVH